jgi:hypothetical protein
VTPFHDLYRIRGNDPLELKGIAKAWGYDNPGPIVLYPPNSALFRPNTSPMLLPAGQTLRIPWHPRVLQKVIATSNRLATEVARDAAELISEQHENKEKLESLFTTLEAISIVANMGVGLAFAAKDAGAAMGVKALVKEGAHATQHAAEEFVKAISIAGAHTAAEITSLLASHIPPRRRRIYRSDKQYARLARADQMGVASHGDKGRGR